MSKNKGSAIAQYGIIILLLLVACVVGFSLIGKQLFQSFDQLTNIFINNNENINNNIMSMSIKQGTVTPGTLNGSPDNPVKKCVNGVCVIDFGDFIFNGLPDDLGNFIETAGTSGANDKLASYFDVIASYLESQGDTAGSEEYKNLANLGYFYSQMEKVTENAVTSCKSEPANKIDTCIKQYFDANKITLPENVSTLLPKYKGINTDLIEIMDSDKMDISKALYNLQSGTHDYSTSREPSYAIATVYKGIMDNAKYSTELKNITQELFANIADLSLDQSNKVLCLTGRGCKPNVFDPITLEKTTNVDYSAIATPDEILAPDASNFTDIDSSLICVAGQNTVNGHSCHNDN